ncbi:MAG: thioredoxin family protein [Clostridioides sp.]|jgi:hypothetical protein|nr:thioredoxin family protein [Clostridioides sp.]
MEKILVEFINTCPTCEEHARVIKEICDKYPEKIDLKIYYAGKDFSYIKKYGVITKGTMIINQKKKVDRLSKSNIEKTILEVIG